MFETREEKLARGKQTYGSKRDNSYGNIMIQSDIDKGMTEEQIIKKIQTRYPDIGYSQAKGIYEGVLKGGSTDWSHYKSE